MFLQFLSNPKKSFRCSVKLTFAKNASQRKMGESRAVQKRQQSLQIKFKIEFSQQLNKSPKVQKIQKVNEHRWV